jgi:hypothetical protein
MNQDTHAFEVQSFFEEDAVTRSDLVGYWRPRDIVEDPTLTLSRKRALLAHWASDIHAVDGSPALRCACGVTVHIDLLFDALKQLDEMIDPAAMSSAGSSQAASS